MHRLLIIESCLSDLFVVEQPPNNDKSSQNGLQPIPAKTENEVKQFLFVLPAPPKSSKISLFSVGEGWCFHRKIHTSLDIYPTLLQNMIQLFISGRDNS